MTDTATTDPTHPIADTDAVIDNAEEEDIVRATAARACSGPDADAVFRL